MKFTEKVASDQDASYVPGKPSHRDWPKAFPLVTVALAYYPLKTPPLAGVDGTVSLSCYNVSVF
jgi:hypothetical protein